MENPHSSPMMVPCVKEGSGRADGCHNNAKRVSQAYGGTVQRGWSIRTWIGVSVWMELHSVWRHPEGELLCVTEPPSAHLDRIAFLPGCSMGAMDSGPPSIHVPWEDVPLCHQFVELMYALDRIYFVAGDPLHTKGHIRMDRADRWRRRMKEIARLRLNQMKMHNKASLPTGNRSQNPHQPPCPDPAAGL